MQTTTQAKISHVAPQEPNRVARLKYHYENSKITRVHEESTPEMPPHLPKIVGIPVAISLAPRDSAESKLAGQRWPLEVGHVLG